MATAMYLGAGIIASKRCNNVEIFNNDVWNSGKSGIYLHRNSDDSKVFGEFPYSVAHPYP